MKKPFWTIASSLVAAGITVASSSFSPASAASISYLASPFYGNSSEVKITLDDEIAGLGKVQFKVDVVPNPFIGDIRGVFFNILNNSLLKNLVITGSDITEVVKRPGDVSATSNGASIMSEGRFDMGLQIGTPKRVIDDIQSTIFTISHPDIALDLAQFTTETDPVTNQGPKSLLFGVDLRSIGRVGGPRSGLSKLGAGLDDKVIVPEPSTTAALGLVALGAFGLLKKNKKQLNKNGAGVSSI